MYSIFSAAESVGLNSTAPLRSPYLTPTAIAFFTNSFSFFSFFMIRNTNAAFQRNFAARSVAKCPCYLALLGIYIS